MLKYHFIFIVLLFCPRAFSESLSEKPEWNVFFADESVTGVFVLCKGNTRSCITNNRERAAIQFLPGSTFKIPNALIALESGVIKNQHEVFKWGGEPRILKQWENDFTLRGAMQASAVPVFQQFARAISEKRMGQYLNQFSYGNKLIDGGIDHFWLDGQLKISAMQQVKFLEKLYLGKLPVSQENQLIVKDALVSESNPGYLIRAKTGYSLAVPGFGDRTKPGIGWWVGWIEKGTEVYFFATNIDVEKDSQLPARKTIPIKIMQQENIWSWKP